MTKRKHQRRAADLRRVLQPHAARTSETRTSAIRQARKAHDQWLLAILRCSLANATAPEVQARLRGAIERLKSKTQAA
jgi:hypothetical protein